jgi:hypothetical protein
MREVEDISDLKAVMRGEAKLQDSTVMTILLRHPEWKNSLVVMDWTASMYTYGAQLLLWHRLNLENNVSKVTHFTFFNDGDKKRMGEKRVGKTGGIYKAATNSIEDVIRVMAKTMQQGTGGEPEENDIEALLMGIERLKDYEDIILIADNSPIRDMGLLKEIKKPIRVLICDPYKGWVNPEYVRIAFETGGSLHTLEADIENRMQLQDKDSKIMTSPFEMIGTGIMRIKDLK